MKLCLTDFLLLYITRNSKQTMQKLDQSIMAKVLFAISLANQVVTANAVQQNYLWQSYLRIRAMLNLAFVMGFVGVAVGLMIAMFIFGSIDNAINCTSIINTTGQVNCNLVKTTSWTVLGILPITLFFVLFSIFGGFAK